MITCTDCAFRPRETLFELRDGPETEIEMARGLLPGTGVAGEGGTAIPVLVRRF